MEQARPQSGRQVRARNKGPGVRSQTPIRSNLKTQTLRCRETPEGSFIYLSDDGMNWTKRNMPKNGEWRDIAYNGEYYMALYFIDTNDGEITLSGYDNFKGNFSFYSHHF